MIGGIVKYICCCVLHWLMMVQCSSFGSGSSWMGVVGVVADDASADVDDGIR